jgi:hypothetical protein
MLRVLNYSAKQCQRFFAVSVTFYYQFALLWCKFNPNIRHYPFRLACAMLCAKKTLAAKASAIISRKRMCVQ